MKTIFKIFILFFLLFSCIFSSLSAKSNSSDSTSEARFALPPKDTTLYSIILIGGFGLATGRGYYSAWNEKFNLGPAIDLGIEIPFTKAHRFSFEFIEHFWISQIKLKDEPDKYKEFIKIYQNTYGEGGLSFAIKYYFGKKTSKFRVSIHLGSLVGGFKDNYSSLEYGFGFNYRVNDYWDINLTRKLFLGNINLAGGGPETNTPNLLLLNIHYRLIL